MYVYGRIYVCIYMYASFVLESPSCLSVRYTWVYTDSSSSRMYMCAVLVERS